ncbi:MAG: hypothetical protein [Vetruanivirus porcinprimi]|uniref:Uncharacterized protein n=1 Tax=phage Lak_Megaphage_RVC_AP1_GC26 TaxID=3109224 RepID=A0ABZ0Z5P6_9CAUD|nr:MAG: hypothetical protein [phage Lak_Megaphage_RVC_AP1_GC26]
MIKFKEKNNNVNKLIDLIYQILNDSYNEYIHKKEKEKLKQSLQNNFKNKSNYINIDSYLDLNKILSNYIKIDPY